MSHQLQKIQKTKKIIANPNNFSTKKYSIRSY